MELKAKVVVVTGAASGIGLALAGRFVQEGARVVASDLNAELGAQRAAEVGARFVAANVAKEEALAGLIGDVLEQEGHIDLFCSNAGVALNGGPEAPDKAWELSHRVNVMAHVWAARHLLPHYLARGEGYFLNTASAAGLLTELHSAPYTVTKHAAVAFAEWLAISYQDRGVRVSCLCPEFVQTPMIENAGDDWAAIRARAIPVEMVSQAVVEALREERFLVLTHPTTLPAFQARAQNHESWLAAMRGYRARNFGGEQ